MAMTAPAVSREGRPSLQFSRMFFQIGRMTGTVFFFAAFLFCLISPPLNPASAKATHFTENAVTINVTDAVSGGMEQIASITSLQDNLASSDTTLNVDYLRKVRNDVSGLVSNPDKRAGLLINVDGEQSRQTRTGTLPLYGAYALYGTCFALGIFYITRGRIRVGRGFSGRLIERFTAIERIGHWIMAVSFIVLGLTGLNLIYGSEIWVPLFGKAFFAGSVELGTWLHIYTAFVFMAGLVVCFFFWVRQSIPSRVDLKWLVQGGGIFTEGGSPPAKKFNAGQKILFWLILVLGIAISLSGIALLFPFQFSMFSRTFAFLNMFGFDLPTELSQVQEMHYAALWHAIVAIFMICVVTAHIYFRTLGIEGAFDAMGSGKVDVNWAREHHNLWAEEVLGPDPEGPGHGPGQGVGNSGALDPKVPDVAG